MKPESVELFIQQHRLTTAEILYHMPDYPSLLQIYIWQDLDSNPDFPKLKKFLEFWERKLDGRLHSVSVAACEFIKPAEVICTDGKFYLN